MSKKKPDREDFLQQLKPNPLHDAARAQLHGVIHSFASSGVDVEIIIKLLMLEVVRLVTAATAMRLSTVLQLHTLMIKVHEMLGSKPKV